MKKKLNIIVPPHIEGLQPYKPGRSTEINHNFVNLASNENPMVPPLSILMAIQEALPEICRYPDPAAVKLRTALAEHYNVKMENVAVGAGSASILDNIIRAFLSEGDEVLTVEGTFTGFYVLVRAKGIKLNLVPLKNYRFDLEVIADAVTNKTKVIYLCNPNNPTGTIFTRQEFEAFINKIPEHILVILDEAYCEFTSGLPEFPDLMSYRYDNVITIRTFAKAYSLAGLRLGYGIGHEYLIDFINRVKSPFEPSNLAQAAGIAAIFDKDHLPKTLENTRLGKATLVEAFQKLELKQVQSFANFVMLDFGSEARVNQLHQRLLSLGVAIRPLKAYGLPHCLRVTVGLPKENEMFIQALRKSL